MVTSRIWFTAAQKAELWERWKSGSSAAAISRALDRRDKSGGPRIVTLHGGIAPAPHRRALAALRLEEREEISRGIAVGKSIRQIALGLGRAPSTVRWESSGGVSACLGCGQVDQTYGSWLWGSAAEGDPAAQAQGRPPLLPCQP